MKQSSLLTISQGHDGWQTWQFGQLLGIVDLFAGTAKADSGRISLIANFHQPQGNCRKTRGILEPKFSQSGWYWHNTRPR